MENLYTKLLYLLIEAHDQKYSIEYIYLQFL